MQLTGSSSTQRTAPLVRTFCSWQCTIGRRRGYCMTELQKLSLHVLVVRPHAGRFVEGRRQTPRRFLVRRAFQRRELSTWSINASFRWFEGSDTPQRTKRLSKIEPCRRISAPMQTGKDPVWHQRLPRGGGQHSSKQIFRARSLYIHDFFRLVNDVQ